MLKAPLWATSRLMAAPAPIQRYPPTAAANVPLSNASWKTGVPCDGLGVGVGIGSGVGSGVGVVACSGWVTLTFARPFLPLARAVTSASPGFRAATTPFGETDTTSGLELSHTTATAAVASIRRLSPVTSVADVTLSPSTSSICVDGAVTASPHPGATDMTARTNACFTKELRTAIDSPLTSWCGKTSGVAAALRHASARALRRSAQGEGVHDRGSSLGLGKRKQAASHESRSGNRFAGGPANVAGEPAVVPWLCVTAFRRLCSEQRVVLGAARSGPFPWTGPRPLERAPVRTRDIPRARARRWP